MSGSIPPSEGFTPREPSKPGGADADWRAGRRVCVACGEVFARSETRCPQCLQDHSPEALSRLADFAGNWFVFDPDHPVPGVKLDFLIKQARRGNLTATTIVRGPETKQQWKFAGETPGLAQHVGLCWFCGQQVQPSDPACPSCHVSFELSPQAPVKTEVTSSLAHPAAPLAEQIPVARQVSDADLPVALAELPDGQADESGVELAVAEAPAKRRQEAKGVNPALLVATVFSVALAVIFGVKLFYNPPQQICFVPPLPAAIPTATGYVAPWVTVQPTLPPQNTEEPSFFGLTPSGTPAAATSAENMTPPASTEAEIAEEEPTATESAPASAPATQPDPFDKVFQADAERLWKEADKLEKKDTLESLKSAADKLNEIKNTLPHRHWPKGLMDRLQTLQSKIKKKQDEASKFFGV